MKRIQFIVNGDVSDMWKGFLNVIKNVRDVEYLSTVTLRYT